ncbi:MAG: hypothetical protein ACXW13_00050 [Burkholderiaceae bacterium]
MTYQIEISLVEGATIRAALLAYARATIAHAAPSCDAECAALYRLCDKIKAPAPAPVRLNGRADPAPRAPRVRPALDWQNNAAFFESLLAEIRDARADSDGAAVLISDDTAMTLCGVLSGLITAETRDAESEDSHAWRGR